MTAESLTAAPSLELAWENVSVEVRERRLLDGVSLRVRRGEFVVVVGPNGAGKTTLLKTALGLIRPSRGRVALDGRDLRALSARARAAELAWLKQNPELDEPLTAREVVASARYRFKESHEQSLKAAERALERVGAASYRVRKLPTLSGGERQRVMLAALLAQETPLLLLDEPANHLDPAHQIDAYALVGALFRDGRGIVCVTHDLNLLGYAAEPECIRVVGLRAGALAFECPLSEPALPQHLSELFGVEMVAADISGQRVLVPNRRTPLAGKRT